MKTKLVIFGKGKMAELAFFYFTQDSDYEVVAFCLDRDYRDVDMYLGLPIVDFELVEELYAPEDYTMFIALGYTSLNLIREQKFEAAKLKGYKLASYVSSKSDSWGDAKIGENVFIMESNTIMPFCTIEDNVLVWVGNILSHHSIIKKHTTITSHVAIGGGVEIGINCFLGLNSTIRDSIKVANYNIIGAGTNVIRSTAPNGLYLGNPAKLIKNVEGVKL